jgi:transposase InsO family protein
MDRDQLKRLKDLEKKNKQLKKLARDLSPDKDPSTRTSPNHVWSYDFLFDATADGRRLKGMPVIDEHTREYLALEVSRSMTSTDIIDVLDRPVEQRGAPSFIRSDNGPEFVADAVRSHL